jgi:hypothetical protein
MIDYEKELKKLPEYQEQYKELQKEMKKLIGRATKLEEKIIELERISEVYLKVPLHISFSSDYALDVADLSYIRHAHIYHNATVHSTVDNWGLEIGAREGLGPLGTHWLGTGHTKVAAINIAKDWIALGTYPKELDD